MADAESDYLESVKEIYEKMMDLDEDYKEVRASYKTELARTVEEGRFKTDLSVKEFADYLGIKRQTLNKILISVYGVRYPEKAKAASLGHEND
jgi:hypothetical protein